MVADALRTDVVWVLQVSPDGRSLLVAASNGLDDRQSMAAILANDSSSMSGRALRSSKPLTVTDIARDRRWSTIDRGHEGTMLSGISIAIRGSPRHPFGLLTARSRRPRQCGPAEIQFMSDVAELLAQAIARIAKERRRRDRESRFRELVERAPDVVMRSRLTGVPTLEYISPSVFAVTGYRPEDLYRSRRLRWKLVHPHDRPKFKEYLVSPETTAYPPIVRWIRKDGSSVWMEQRLSSVRDEQGRIIGVEAIARDVTGRIFAERRRDAIVQITNSMLEGASSDDTLRLVATATRGLLGADTVMILVLLRGGTARIMATADDAGGNLEGATLPVPDPLIDRIATERAALAVEEIAGVLPPAHLFAKLGWIGAALVVPLRRRQTLVGAMIVANDRQRRRFSSSEMEAVEAFAGQAVLAIQYGLAREEVQRLAVLEDRSRIARELHDGVIQSLFGAGMGLQAVAETAGVTPETESSLARVSQIIDNAMQDLRNYIFDLQPTALLGRDLAGALELLARDFETTSGIRCTVTVDPNLAGAPAGMPAHIVQILREALSNISRHAAATSCHINVGHTHNELVIEVTDNGRGFSPQPNGGQGLHNIRRRAAELGGSAEFISALGRGATVRVRLPLAGQEVSSATVT